ncbi:MAG: hypothetical protein AAF645_29370, partial [Myxococcota bacterium]
LECVSGACVDCARGEVDCRCFDNGACTEGSVCQDGVCAVCTPGTENCSCNEGQCDDPWSCQFGRCLAPGCTPGTEGCVCWVGGECDPGLACTVGGLCGQCFDDTPGCPCGDDDACQNALLCDTGFCRSALTCAEVGCVENQVCIESSGADAQCPEECVFGFEWNAENASCDPVPPNCGVGTPGSILSECQALERECVEDVSGASCGECMAFFSPLTADAGSACRPQFDCPDLPNSCAASNRACDPPGATGDATCGACLPGFVESGGQCVLDTLTSCAGGVDGLCAALNSECEDQSGGGALCGACATGFEFDPLSESCVVEQTCATLNATCALENRTCVSEPVARCDRCLPGFVAVGGDCRAVLTCVDVSCSGSEFCVPETDSTDARCVEQTCGATQALDLVQGVCRECGACEESESETGRLWPYLTRAGGECVCETKDGYFFDEGRRAAVQCDADGDGWVNSRAIRAIDSSDETLSLNARCDVRTVNRFELRNELGQSIEVRSCEAGFAGPADPRCTRFVSIPLYERDWNDDALLVPPTPLTYGGRALAVNEVNSFTRACASVGGDFNGNGVENVLD